MRLITLNLNGIRSAQRKGFFAWVTAQHADIICLQEIKAHEIDIIDEAFHLPGYHRYLNCAAKKGYSGVGIYSCYEPMRVIKQLGWPEADTEGRYLQLDFEKYSVVSLYLPSGTSGDIRQTVKYDFLDRYGKHLSGHAAEKREYIISGDWNIAHTNMDLKNWRSNQNTSGFLPAERAWMDKLFGELGFVDAFRVVNQTADQYTWWSYRARAWEKNVGWRIDYQVITPGLKAAIKRASIYKEQRFSDHAPVIVDYDFEHE